MGSFAARCLSEQGMMRAEQTPHGNHSTAASPLLLSTCIALEDVPKDSLLSQRQAFMRKHHPAGAD